MTTIMMTKAAHKTDAIIVMVSAGDNGRVDAVMSLANWIQQNGQYNSDKVLDVLNDLDVYDAEGNNIAEALGSVLNIKELSPQIRLRYLSVVSKAWVHMKHPALWEALTALSNSDDKEVSARAQQLLK